MTEFVPALRGMRIGERSRVEPRLIEQADAPATWRSEDVRYPSSELFLLNCALQDCNVEHLLAELGRIRYSNGHGVREPSALRILPMKLKTAVASSYLPGHVVRDPRLGEESHFPGRVLAEITQEIDGFPYIRTSDIVSISAVSERTAGGAFEVRFGIASGALSDEMTHVTDQSWTGGPDPNIEMELQEALMQFAS